MSIDFKMKDRVVLITGSSSGIGLITAEVLAGKGARIILTGRSEEKLKLANERIKASTGVRDLKYYVVDLASQKSIRAMAENVKRDYDQIDVLINNAGGFFTGFKLTEDGLERTIALNHFSYFLLTNLLLEHILKSDYSRIISLSSESHYNGKIDFESFQKNKGYNFRNGYSQSKLANVLFTRELARRLEGTNVTANVVHPGFIKTDLGNKGTNWYLRWFWTSTSMLFGLPLEEGAKASVYLATSEDVKGLSGKYFERLKEKEPADIAKDIALQKELWQVSEKLCGEKFM